MIVPQYPDPNWLVKYSKGKSERPSVMSEFAHIMGNSLGNFKEYWDAIENNPKLQGGFIWEWIDQAIDTLKNGKKIFAYGGDFPLEGPVNEDFSDNNFCVKGVVTAYRGLTPMAVEAKKVFQYIKTSHLGSNQISVNNSYFFRDISNVQLNGEILEEGKVVQNGLVNNLNINPRQTSTLTLPFKTNYKDGKEYFLNIRYVLKTAEPFLEKGYDIAYEQIALGVAPKAFDYDRKKAKLKVTQTAEELKVSGTNFSIRFDLVKRVLSNYIVGGTDILAKGPQPGFYRAPTDNDIGAGLNKSLRMWRNVYDENRQIAKKTTVTATDYAAGIIITSSLLNGDAETVQKFIISPEGTIKVVNQFKAVTGKYKTGYFYE